MRSILPALACLVAGILLGFGIADSRGGRTGDAPRSFTARQSGSIGNPRTPPDPGPITDRVRQGEEPRRFDRDGVEAPRDMFFTARLLAHAREDLAEGWASARPDAIPEKTLDAGVERFEEEVMALPAVIGAELARRQTEKELALEDARTGGVFEVLAGLEAGTTSGPLFELTDTEQTFDDLFRAEVSGPGLDGTRILSPGQLTAEPPADGSTLQFPAGVHTIDDFGAYWRTRFPRDLTLRGAGMNATLIVLRSDLFAYDRVRNLTIEDCTIHAGNDYLFDVRQPAMSVTIRRTRLTGWKTGAGSSCLFGTEALALRVVDSVITGAYCRAPVHGQMFDVRHDGLVARFDSCRIEAMRPFTYFGRGATVSFVNCIMSNVSYREIPPSVRLVGTTPDRFEGTDHNVLRRDLNELFPDWERRANGR